MIVFHLMIIDLPLLSHSTTFNIHLLKGYKVCLCFVVLSVTVCTVGYVCSFRGGQIFVELVSYP